MQPDGVEIGAMGATGLILPDLTDFPSSNSPWGASSTSLDSLLGTILNSPLVQDFLAYHPLDKTPPKLTFGLLDDTGSSELPTIPQFKVLPKIILDFGEFKPN
jgi:hypothetical protein